MLSRRELLRTGAGAAAAALAAPALDLAPVARAASRADYRLGFSSLRREISLDRLPQHGTLPEWLSGTLVRNGPALYEAGAETFNHWFDGLAMLHAFTLRGGHVGYANRFLRSSAYRAATTEHRILYSEFATDPCRSIFNGAAAMFVPAPVPNANVNVTQIARRFVALTEVPLPVTFDPHTLRTLGVDGPPAPLAQLGTAHPHRDRGQRFRHDTKLLPPAGYLVYRDDQQIGQVTVDQASYLHSFGLTRRYVVLADYPFTVDPLQMLQQWRPVIQNYRWDPGRPAHFYVVDRANGQLVARLETDPFFSFHHVNAFERDGQVIVDLLAYENADVIDALYLKQLRDPKGRIPSSLARRYVLDLGRGRVTHSTLGPGVIELPRINYDAVNTKPYRYVYAAGLRSRETSRFLDQLVKLDVVSGERRTWHEPGCFPGEAVFVAAPHARGEDDGVALSVVLDTRTRTSFLLVLDAKTFQERARATVPHHIPFGFHGQLF